MPVSATRTSYSPLTAGVTTPCKAWPGAMICTPAWRANSGIDLPASSAGMSMGFAWAQAPEEQIRAKHATLPCSAAFENLRIINSL
jgi:hypothetical protein